MAAVKFYLPLWRYIITTNMWFAFTVSQITGGDGDPCRLKSSHNLFIYSNQCFFSSWWTKTIDDAWKDVPKSMWEFEQKAPMSRWFYQWNNCFQEEEGKKKKTQSNDVWQAQNILQWNSSNGQGLRAVCRWQKAWIASQHGKMVISRTEHNVPDLHRESYQSFFLTIHHITSCTYFEILYFYCTSH